MRDETSPSFDRSVLLFPSWAKAYVRDLTDPRLSVLLFGGDADGQEDGCRKRGGEGPDGTPCTRDGAGS